MAGILNCFRQRTRRRIALVIAVPLAVIGLWLSLSDLLADIDSTDKSPHQSIKSFEDRSAASAGHVDISDVSNIPVTPTEPRKPEIGGGIAPTNASGDETFAPPKSPPTEVPARLGLVGGPPCEAPWATAYARLHAGIVAGAAAPRFLVGVAPTSGLADRLLTHLAQLFWGVLSGRAIQFMEWAAVAALEPALHPRCVDWRLPRDAHPRGAWISILKRSLCNECIYNASVVNETWGAVPMAFSKAAMRHHYGERNLSSCPPELQQIPHVMDVATGGALRFLWTNPHHRDTLGAIAPVEGALRTAWDFLFAPSAAVRDIMQPYEKALAGALVVAIHIRVGDNSFAEAPQPDASLETFGDSVAGYFACAKSLNLTAAASRAAPGAPVRWFLASDSLELRRAAKRRFGDLLVTNTDSPSQHIGGAIEGDAAQGNAGEQVVAKDHSRAMITSVADLLLLSRGVVHVLTPESGFGRMAALLSKGVGAHITWGGENCASRMHSRGDHSVLEGWSGIR